MNVASAHSNVTPLEHRNPETAREIVDLQNVAYVIEARMIGFADLPPLADEPMDIMASDERFFGVSQSGGLAGLIALEDGPERTMVSRLCVTPDLVRRGIASRLLRYVLAHTETDLIVTTAQANLPAIALYERMGFIATETRLSREGLPLVTLVSGRT